MTPARACASWLLNRAAALAPEDRLEWTTAAKAEMDVLDGDVPALHWALGTFAAAAFWRARAESTFLILVSSVIAFSPGLDKLLCETSVRAGLVPWRTTTDLQIFGSLFTALAAAVGGGLLAVFRPKHALACACLLGMAWWPSHLFVILASGQISGWSIPGAPHTASYSIQRWAFFASMFAWPLFGPSLTGALSGAAIVRLAKRARR